MERKIYENLEIEVTADVDVITTSGEDEYWPGMPNPPVVQNESSYNT